MALTREQALEELLRNQRELDRLNARQADLKKIVLLQIGPEVHAKKMYSNTATRGMVGTENERVLKVLVEHGGWLTVHEIVTLLGGADAGYYDNKVRQTTDRLKERHLINRDKNQFGRIIFQTAIHPDKSEKEVANDE